MASIFDLLTLQDCQSAVATRTLSIEEQQSRNLYEGDHWLNGFGWLGQLPPPGTEGRDTMIDAIKSTLVSENVIAEVTHRHRSGILGREPKWAFVPRRPMEDDEEPTAEETTLIKEVEAAITAWWDIRGGLDILQRALVGSLLEEYAPLRLFVPSGLRDGAGQVTAKDPETALTDFVYLDVLRPGEAGVFTDDYTRRQVGIYVYPQAPAENKPSLPGSHSSSTDVVAEVTYLDDDSKLTQVKIIGRDGTVDEARPLMHLNGHLMINELRREPLITPQLRRQQMSLNLTLTQMLRNVNLAGSLERILINLMPPGKWVSSVDGTPWVDGTSAGEKVFVKEALPVGAGVSAFLRGIETKNEDGEVTGVTSGTVNYRDPVPVTTFVETRDLVYASMLNQVDQKHALISGDAAATGESRKQARAEFEGSLDYSKGALDKVGRWLCETLAALAALICNQAGRYDGLRCEFAAIVDSGPLAADERRVFAEENEKGLASLPTTLSRLGVDDVQAELALIQADQAAAEEKAARMMDIMAANADDGEEEDDGTLDDNTDPQNRRPRAVA